MAVRTIEQKITAGSQFDGTLPTTTKVVEFDMERFPTDTQGGLFDFGITDPIMLSQVMIKLGGQTSWTFSVVDVDDVEVEVTGGTNDAQFVSTREVGALAGLILLEGQRLKITTIGATTAMVARVSLGNGNL